MAITPGHRTVHKCNVCTLGRNSCRARYRRCDIRNGRTRLFFLVHNVRAPQPKGEVTAILRVRWDDIDLSTYHPRLKLDYGGELRKGLNAAKAYLNFDWHMAIWGEPDPIGDG